MAPAVEPESSASAFRLICQRVSLQLSFRTPKFYGRTALYVLPCTPDLSQLCLNSRNLQISAITVNQIETTYTLTTLPPLPRPASDTTSTIQAHERDLLNFTLDGLDGELAIDIPGSIKLERLEETDAQRQAFSLWDDGGENVFLPNDILYDNQEYYTPLRIDILYEGRVSDLEPGIRALGMSGGSQRPSVLCAYGRPHPSDTHTPGYYAWLVRQALHPDASLWTPRVDRLSNRSPSGTARYWVPCRDTVRERCVWDISIGVDNSSSFSEIESDQDLVAFCTGVRLPDVAGNRFAILEPIAAPNVSFTILSPESQLCLNSSSSIVVPVSPQLARAATHVDRATTAVYALKEVTGDLLDEEFVSVACYRIRSVNDVIVRVHTDIAPSSQVFGACQSVLQRSIQKAVDGNHISGAFHEVDIVLKTDGVTLVGTDFVFLRAPRNEYLEDEWRWRTLAVELCWEMWTGSVRWIPKTWGDFWLTYGVMQKSVLDTFRDIFGQNERLYRLKSGLTRIHLLEEHGKDFRTFSESLLDFDGLDGITTDFFAPLASSWHPDLAFLKQKSGLLFEIMMNNGRNIVDLLQSAPDIEQIRKMYVDCSGIPEVEVTCGVNRKRMVLELDMKQESRHRDVRQKPLKGDIVLRVHEPDGYPYEHILGLQSAIQHCEVRYHSKTRRIRRLEAGSSRKRSDFAGSGTQLGVNLEDEATRRRRKPADDDFTERFDWIRLDPQMTWLAHIQFDLPQMVWIAQLEKDVNVFAQFEAIYSLTHPLDHHNGPSDELGPRGLGKDTDDDRDTVLACIKSSIFDHRLFWRFRIDSIETLKSLDKSGHFLLKAMSEIGSAESEDIGNNGQEKECNSDEVEQLAADEVGPESVAIDHFIMRGILEALGECARYVEHRQACIRTLLNFSNASNVMVTVSVIRALCEACLPPLADTSVREPLPNVGEEILFLHSDEQEGIDRWTDKAVREIERLRAWDLLRPSPGRYISLACIKALRRLMSYEVIEKNLAIFLAYTSSDMPDEIRLAAFAALVELGALSEVRGMLSYLLSTVSGDRSVVIRRGVAKLVAEQRNFVPATEAEIWQAWTLLQEAPMCLRHWVLRIALSILSSEKARALLVVPPPPPKLKIRVNQPKPEPPRGDRKKITISLRTPSTARATPPADPQGVLEGSFPDETSAFPHTNDSQSGSAAAFFGGRVEDSDIEMALPEKAGVSNLSRNRESSPLDRPTISLSENVANGKANEPAEETVLSPLGKDTLTTSPLRIDGGPVNDLARRNGYRLTQSDSKDEVPLQDHEEKSQLAVGTIGTPVQSQFCQSPDVVAGGPVVSLAQSPSGVRDMPRDGGQNTSFTGVPETINITDSESDESMITSSDPPPGVWTPVAQRILKRLNSSKFSVWFRFPVPETVPQYHDIIRNPMDISTVRSKLENGSYPTSRAFVSDIRLIFRNCYTFNADNTDVSKDGRRLQELFEGELMAILHTTSLAWKYETPITVREEYRGIPVEAVKCRKLLSKLGRSPAGKPFERAVVGIPMYYEMIRDPMDLSMVRRKIPHYQDMAGLVLDLDLMLYNCRVFNSKGDPVYNAGEQLKQELRRLLDGECSFLSLGTGEKAALASPLRVVSRTVGAALELGEATPGDLLPHTVPSPGSKKRKQNATPDGGTHTERRAGRVKSLLLGVGTRDSQGKRMTALSLEPITIDSGSDEKGDDNQMTQIDGKEDEDHDDDVVLVQQTVRGIYGM